MPNPYHDSKSGEEYKSSTPTTDVQPHPPPQPRYPQPTTMYLLFSSLLLITLACAATVAYNDGPDAYAIALPHISINGIPASTRAHWMRRANAALAEVKGGSPCPFGAFGSVIVNHTAPGLGELVCIGANSNAQTGNPTMHGEMAAIRNCTSVLTNPHGRYRLTPAEALEAWADLSLYTNAESCPMCASAIRWTGFREYIYGTSIETLIRNGWGQIRVPSLDIFRQSFDLPTQSRLLGEILTNETDPYFLWQFNPDYPCPNGCSRHAGSCAPH